MQSSRLKLEMALRKPLDISEKVLVAYKLASATELLLRRPRTYHLAGSRGQGLPQEGMPITLVGRLQDYTREKRDRLAIIRNTLDVPGLGGVFLSWLCSVASVGATQRALSSQCPKGTLALVSGKAHYLPGGYLRIQQVEMEPASSAVLAAIEAGELLPIPVYALSGRLRQAQVRSVVRNYLRSGLGAAKEALPSDLERALHLPTLAEAFEVVHGLKAVNRSQAQLLTENRSPYQKRIDVERLWGLMRSMPLLSNTPPPAIVLREGCLDVLEGLSFALTRGQAAAVDDALTDLSKPYVTRRLLQGDVGCGKSIVALLALIVCARSGAPAALLAPTDVLATQLHRAAELLAKQIGIQAHFVTGKLTAAKRRAVEGEARKGAPAIFVGTHALASLPFSHLGLLVIDEEHRFGVELKDRLTALNPHVITMSATPIPRSLATVMYVGHGISSIKERPAGREPVTTEIIDDAVGEARLIEVMRATLQKGQQVFVVCPSIASEEIANVGDMAGLLQSHLGVEQVRMLHGDMVATDIESTLDEFRENEFGVLVATTIIEVGIDVPRATLMVICDPERLGLSQLHQIRGRVGRGSDPGHCALLSKVGGTARERLEFFARTEDGFALAERDLQNRGAGDLSGLAQSGFLDVNVVALADEAIAIHRFLTRSHSPESSHVSADQGEGWLEQLRFEVAI